MKKVLIGIVAKYRDENVDLIKLDSRIRKDVKQAIFDNGAIAIGIISPNRDIQTCGDDWLKYDSLIDKDNIVQQLNLCDGIILQGGNENEALEPFIAKYCYDNNIPCLGICAGQSSLVRALGGTTFLIPNPEDHYQPKEEYVHKIKIDTSSNFYNIIKKEEIMVNSRHKGSIDNCPLLDKVGFSDEGYAEVVEAKNKDFYIGVRFHPETLYGTDDNMNNIIKAFIKSCYNKKTRS